MNLTRGINLRKIAEMMPGASGAEVKVSVKVGQGHVDLVIAASFSLYDCHVWLKYVWLWKQQVQRVHLWHT